MAMIKTGMVCCALLSFANVLSMCAGATVAGTETSGGEGVGMALIIGIGNYDILGPLDCCREDAKAIYQTLLTAGYLSGRVVLLTDESSTAENRATFTNIKRRLKQVCEYAKPADSLVVYFAGHGTSIDGEVYLIPQDGDEKDRENSISLTKLQQQMQDSRAGRKLLVLDACHSGGATRGVTGITPSLKTIGVHVMASCAANELSHPDLVSKHGIFTLCLLEGLNGKADANADGNVSQKELFSYVQQQMMEWGLRTGKTQRPQMLSPTPEDMIISRVSSGVYSSPAAGVPVVGTAPAGLIKDDPRSYLTRGTLGSRGIPASDRFQVVPNRFKTGLDGEIFDTVLNKTWILRAPDELLTWKEAVACASEANARIPTLDELSSLVTANRLPGTWGYVNERFFPASRRTSHYWVSSRGILLRRAVDFKERVCAEHSADDSCALWLIRD
ncbi:MAG: caspase family protein [bacterium]